MDAKLRKALPDCVCRGRFHPRTVKIFRETTVEYQHTHRTEIVCRVCECLHSVKFKGRGYQHSLAGLSSQGMDRAAGAPLFRPDCLSQSTFAGGVLAARGEAGPVLDRAGPGEARGGCASGRLTLMKRPDLCLPLPGLYASVRRAVPVSDPLGSGRARGHGLLGGGPDPA